MEFGQKMEILLKELLEWPFSVFKMENIFENKDF
jgi:hypothetical protein